ncbi:copper resistance protein B [Phenylobacterium aquaticum]|uniref:copper resistance protein B n=1 Tax=Phenylobacterium aquaticum TaxID=1763816 RepID=UPI001F5D8D11|nr:copper resistance protein B [Phenylobacterium aquaticum]MCI3130915.1 copper resistance protein B [Phenylobacterium aquaticum]
MNRLALISLIPLALATPVAAQTMDHSSMPGMAMPAQPAQKAKPKPKPKAKPAAAPARKTPQSKPASSPSATPPAAPMDHSAMPGMTMPAPAAPAAPAPDHSAMPGMAMPADSAPMDHSAMPGMDMGPTAQPDIPKSPPPPPPADRAADRFFPRAEMDQAVAQLRREHGAVITSKVMTNLAEFQARKGADGYRWDGQAWFGGDINRFVLKSEGEGTRGEGIEAAEVQALYSRAVGVYTDVQIGVRQDFEPHNRTYATVGFESLFPYWFDIEGAAFLSNKGELLGRIEGTYDLRLTNRLILQPRAEFNLAAQDTLETRTGSGLSNAELGLRLRYEVRREFAPYIGVSWDRKFGKTADYARALGEDVKATSFVVGLRAFF